MSGFVSILALSLGFSSLLDPGLVQSRFDQGGFPATCRQYAQCDAEGCTRQLDIVQIRLDEIDSKRYRMTSRTQGAVILRRFESVDAARAKLASDPLAEINGILIENHEVLDAFGFTLHSIVRTASPFVVPLTPVEDFIADNSSKWVCQRIKDAERTSP